MKVGILAWLLESRPLCNGPKRAVDGRSFYVKIADRHSLGPTTSGVGYFSREHMGFKNGLVFCVSVEHAKRMAQPLFLFRRELREPFFPALRRRVEHATTTETGGLEVRS